MKWNLRWGLKYHLYFTNFIWVSTSNNNGWILYFHLKWSRANNPSLAVPLICFETDCCSTWHANDLRKKITIDIIGATCTRERKPFPRTVVSAVAQQLLIKNDRIRFQVHFLLAVKLFLRSLATDWRRRSNMIDCCRCNLLDDGLSIYLMLINSKVKKT